ncbi:hypothetical protein BHS62_24140 [Salmonella enterica]|nr:hypothetical protein [Salmonella enterica]
MLTKLASETPLEMEMTGYIWHEKISPNAGANPCNGHSSKTLLCDNDQSELNTWHDRKIPVNPVD